MNEKQILRTICYLDRENRYLQISRKELLDEAAADPQLDADRILNFFTDGMGKFLWNREMTVLKSGGKMIFNIFAILDAVIALRKDRPPDCPISGERLDELLELLLIMELSGTGKISQHNQHVNHKAIIEGMQTVGERRFLAASSDGHAWVVEVRKEPKDLYLVTYLNSGQGLEIHRARNERSEYFAQYRLSLEEIEGLNYFIDGNRSTFDMYPKARRIDSPISATDLIGSQKLSTCHVKGIYVALKWFFREMDPSNATYLWWKAWHLNYRIPQIKELLRGRSASPVIDGNSRYPLSTLIISHHVKRLREAANNPPNPLTQQICQMLDKEEESAIATIQPAGLIDQSLDRLYPIKDQIIQAVIKSLLLALVIAMIVHRGGEALIPIGFFFLQLLVTRSELRRMN